MSDHREAIAEVLAAHVDHMDGYTIPALNSDFLRGWNHALGLMRRDAGFVADALLGSDVLAQIRAEARAEAVEIARFGQRFWPRVQVGAQGECWPWTGPTIGYGHGRFDTPAGQTAHRFAWATANGRLPAAGEVIRHRCDNPPCCNPAHLEAGCQRDNVDDMIDRGRAGFTRTTCRNGHERTPANTITKGDGTRKCRTCTRAAEKKRREAEVRYPCPFCAAYAGVAWNVVRHARRVHGRELTSAELRDRAVLTAEGSA